ncbi:conserved hypothetical protein [delta proteobacterium NaphS2]|nr:conserved hypothetical protein [delta proteobacterium NaphS2]
MPNSLKFKGFTLKSSCHRGILTRPQVRYFQVAILGIGSK